MPPAGVVRPLEKINSIIWRRIWSRLQGASMGAYLLYVRIDATPQTASKTSQIVEFISSSGLNLSLYNHILFAGILRRYHPFLSFFRSDNSPCRRGRLSVPVCPKVHNHSPGSGCTHRIFYRGGIVFPQFRHRNPVVGSARRCRRRYHWTLVTRCICNPDSHYRRKIYHSAPV